MQIFSVPKLKYTGSLHTAIHVNDDAAIYTDA